MSKKAKRILAKLNDPRHKKRLMGEVNLLDQDATAKVGGDQEMTILREMNCLEDEHDAYMQSLKGE
jgi:hypothetical protein